MALEPFTVWRGIAIKKSLDSGGVFDSAHTLLVCSPAPLVFLVPRITETAATAITRLEDFKGHWSYREHLNEQVEMIECLNRWKSSQMGREVLVLGGKHVAFSQLSVC